MSSLIDSPGSALKFLRTSTRLTVEQAATAAGVSADVLHEVEQGDLQAPSPEWLGAVAEALGAYLASP